MPAILSRPQYVKVFKKKKKSVIKGPDFMNNENQKGTNHNLLITL